MLNVLIADLPFGISITKILLHLLNFVILAIGLTFLLYKPVLKFIKKRQSDIQEGIDKGEKMQAEASERKAEYEKLVEEADVAAAEAKKSAQAEGEEKAKTIVSAAEDEARKIRENAQLDAQEIKKAAVMEAKDQITDAVIGLTQEILDRELTKEDNERLISKRLEEWKEDKE